MKKHPRVQFGMPPFRAQAAITSRLCKPSFFIDRTPSHDELGIARISQVDIGPVCRPDAQDSFGLAASVVTKYDGLERSVCRDGPICLARVRRANATPSGRFILSEQGRRKLCRRTCQINRIPAIVSVAGNRAQIDINLGTPAELFAISLEASVDAGKPRSEHPLSGINQVHSAGREVVNGISHV